MEKLSWTIRNVSTVLPWPQTTSNIWIVFTFCSILTKTVPSLRLIASHGKCDFSSRGLKKSSSGSYLEDLADRLHEALFVPKKLFVHLYIIGAACALYHLHLTINSLSLQSQILSNYCSTRIYAMSLLSSYPLPLVLLLWTGHLLRRLFETLFITQYGDSRMHVGGYVAGIVHYIVVPITFVEACSDTTIVCQDEITSFLQLFFPILLFILANYYQYQTHYILYCMKTEQQRCPKSQSYKLPNKSWFKIVCVPHYTAEIVIYLSFAALLPSTSMSPKLLLLWVSSNLAVVANNQYQWYQQHYPEDIPQKWYILFPYIW